MKKVNMFRAQMGFIILCLGVYLILSNFISNIRIYIGGVLIGAGVWQLYYLVLKRGWIGVRVEE